MSSGVFKNYILNLVNFVFKNYIFFCVFIEPILIIGFGNRAYVQSVLSFDALTKLISFSLFIWSQYIEKRTKAIEYQHASNQNIPTYEHVLVFQKIYYLRNLFKLNKIEVINKNYKKSIKNYH